MSKKTSISPHFQVYLPEASAVMSTSLSAAPAAQPTYDTDPDSGDFQPWGPTNSWPKDVRKKVEDSTTAYPLIARKVGMQFGRGLMYYKIEKSSGELKYTFPDIPVVNQFIMDNDMNYFMLERMMDYAITGNIFAEFIKNKRNTEIMSVFHLEAEFTRFGKIINKQIVDVKYTGNWESADDFETIPFISKRNYDIENLKRYKKKFATHDCLPSPGRPLYAKPPHAGLYKDKGWLDFSNSIPVLMNTLNENAMNIKWHIKIPASYWPSVYTDWEAKTPEQREEIVKAKAKSMEDFLSGNANAGKTFMSHYAIDPMTQQALPGWSIEALDGKDKKDAYLTSVQESDSQTNRAIGMDSSLSGIQGSASKMGAGSGSDKRIGFQNTVAMSYADLYVVTAPLRLIGKYNSWDPDIQWGFWHDVPTTLNESPTGSQSEM